MRLANIECKCGNDDFYLEQRGKNNAIICNRCGAWVKWASKTEVVLFDKQEEDELPRMSFGKAFNMINNPYSKNKNIGIRLPHWKEDVVVRINFPNTQSEMTEPYLYVSSRFGCSVWTPTQAELFSKKWVVVHR